MMDVATLRRVDPKAVLHRLAAAPRPPRRMTALVEHDDDTVGDMTADGEVFSSASGGNLVLVKSGKTSLAARVVLSCSAQTENKVQGISTKSLSAVDASKQVSSAFLPISVNVHMGSFCTPTDVLRNRPSDESLALSSTLTELFKTNPPVALDSLAVEFVAASVSKLKGKSVSEGNTKADDAFVWRLSVHVQVLSHDGSLLDACAVAALVSLGATRFPRVSLVDGVVVNAARQTSGGERMQGEADRRKGKQLALVCLPIPVSFAVLGEHIVADPTFEEESVADGGLVVIARDDKLLGGVTKIGLAPALTPVKLRGLLEVAEKRGAELCNAIKKAIR